MDKLTIITRLSRVITYYSLFILARVCQQMISRAGAQAGRQRQREARGAGGAEGGGSTTTRLGMRAEEDEGGYE